MTDSSSDGSFLTESEYEFVGIGEDSSLSDEEFEADCSITGVVEWQLNQDCPVHMIISDCRINF